MSETNGVPVTVRVRDDLKLNATLLDRIEKWGIPTAVVRFDSGLTTNWTASRVEEVAR